MIRKRFSTVSSRRRFGSGLQSAMESSQVEEKSIREKLQEVTQLQERYEKVLKLLTENMATDAEQLAEEFASAEGEIFQLMEHVNALTPELENSTAALEEVRSQVATMDSDIIAIARHAWKNRRPRKKI